MTGFMLDTDISSYIIKRRPAALVENFEKHGETLNVSVITAAELRFGAEKAARPKRVELVEAYLERLAILDWTNEVTPHYARIRTELERSGKPIGNMDRGGSGFSDRGVSGLLPGQYSNRRADIHEKAKT